MLGIDIDSRWLGGLKSLMITIPGTYVTGFMKTNPNCTKTEIRFIAEH